MHEAKRMNRLEHSADDRKNINKRNFRHSQHSAEQNRFTEQKIVSQGSISKFQLTGYLYCTKRTINAQWRIQIATKVTSGAKFVAGRTRDLRMNP